MSLAKLAVPLSPDLLTMIGAVVSQDTDDVISAFEATPFMLLTVESSTRFTFDLLTDDQMMEAIQEDPDIEVRTIT